MRNIFNFFTSKQELISPQEPNVDIAIKRFVHKECANPYAFLKGYMDLEPKNIYSIEEIRKGKKFYFTSGNHPDHHEQGSDSQRQAQAMSEKLDTICNILLDPHRKKELDIYLDYFHNQGGSKIPFVEPTQASYGM